MDRPVERQRPKVKGDEQAHPNLRFIVSLKNVPNVALDYEDPKGVSIDAIIFGGRAKDREPLTHVITDLAEDVYDGLTLGVQATFATEGEEGTPCYDPMLIYPFMFYPEGEYARHRLRIISQVEHQPAFAHVNWFQRNPKDSHFRRPGYHGNSRALLWLSDLKGGRA